MNNFALQLIFIYLLFSFAYATENFCSDWETYKEEKCIKLINNANLQSFSDAEKTCTANENSKLISIHSSDEQTFLENYLFKQKTVVDNIWLNAKNDNNHVFHWSDGRSLTFSNWAPNNPKISFTANTCVQMNSDELVKGKWANEPCTKKNLVVCERKQKWTLEKMQEVIEKLQKENGELDKIKNQNKNTNEKMLKVIEQLQKADRQNKEANEKLQKTIEQLQGADRQSKDTNEKLQKEMQKFTKNPVPIGFIYVQLPKEKSPQEIWANELGLKWTDISSTFDCTFFRVAGNKAAAFGVIQEEFSPFIDEVTYENCEFTKFFGEKQCDDSFPYERNSKLDRRSPSSWSGRVVTANRYYSSLNGWLPKDTSTSEWTGTIKFHSVGGEVRPRNMAVKVWKRTG